MTNLDEKRDHSILNQLVIPLPEVRMVIVELMKDGFTEIPLGDFLLMLKNISRRAEPIADK